MKETIRSIVGILEFNPQLAGQDITPANLEFGTVVSRRRDRREKSFSGVSALQNNQTNLNANHRASFTAIGDDLNPSVRYHTKNSIGQYRIFCFVFLSLSV